MTKSQIKAELRRSALEDPVPYLMEPEAFAVGFEFMPIGGLWADLDWAGNWRTFALLIAEDL